MSQTGTAIYGINALHDLSSSTFLEIYPWSNSLENLWTTPTSDVNFITMGLSPPATSNKRLRQILQSRSSPLILGTRKSISNSCGYRERRARETLRRIVGELQFRKFLKNGFLTVQGKSGLVYQLFPHNTYAWRDGQRTEHLCAILDGDFPPTDALICRYLMILNDEEQFRKLAIKTPCVTANRQQDSVDLRPLPDIFRELKQVN